MDREREQEIRVSLYADKMLRLALDNKNKIMEKNIYICKEYVKSKYNNICSNCNSNKTYCDYSRTIKLNK